MSALRAPITAKAIAERLGVREATPRTVRRDLEVLRDLGVPVRTVRRGRSVLYCVTDDGPGLRVDLDVLLALRLAAGLLLPFAETPVGKALDHLDRQMQSMVPQHLVRHFAGLVNGVSVRRPDEPSYTGSSAQVVAVREGLALGRMLRVEYAALAGSTSERILNPRHLVYGPRGLYLLAHDESRDGLLRTFRVERMRQVTILSRRAAPDPTFDLDAYLASSPGIFSAEHDPVVVRIRLHAESAVRRLLENPWHASQVLEPLQDGGALLTMHLGTTRELVPNLLGLGPDAEVLEPQSLRVEVLGRLVQARARYMQPPHSRNRSQVVQHSE